MDADSRQSTRVLSHLRGRLRSFLVLGTLLVLVGSVGLVALGALASDALFILPEGLRAAAPWALAAAAVIVIAVGVYALRRLTALRVARSFETNDASLGTAMTNAVQLADMATESDIQQWLRDQAVAYGSGKARHLPTWPVARKRILTAAGVVAGMLLLWGGGFVLFNDVFDAVLPRFLDPHGDHPPYARLKIDAGIEQPQVIYGGQCEITATTSGAPVDKLFLVTETEDGRNETVMFRRPDRSYFQTLTNVRQPTRLWVTDGRARSYRHGISIRYTPQINIVQVAMRFPEYTALAERRQQMKESTLNVPKRTNIEFTLTSNRPLTGGMMELTPVLGGEKRSVPLVVESGDDKTVRGSFEADQALAFALTITDTDGTPCSEPRKGRVTITADRRPRIVVLEPNHHAVATPSVALPVHVRAEDDYAVDNVVWFRGFNQSIERPYQMAMQDTAMPMRVESKGKFDLSDLGVKPGDKIEYFFEAVDNYPEGPNITTSRIYTLQIISEKEYMDILRQEAVREALFEQYQILNEFLRRLAEQAETLRQSNDQLAQQAQPPSDAQQDQLQQDAGKLSAQMQEYMKGLQNAMGKPSLFDIEKEFKEELRKQLEKMKELQKKLDEMRKNAKEGKPKPGSPYGGGMMDPEGMADLAKQLGEMSGKMGENVGQPVEFLLSVARLLAEADKFVQLTLKQKELVQLLKRFKDEEGELTRIQQIELQELAAAEERIRDGLREFTETLPELQQALPDEEEYHKLMDTVDEFVEKVFNAGIQDDLDDAAEELLALNGPSGYPLALDAYEKMDALIGRCKAISGEGMGCLKFQPNMSLMSNALSQMLAAMKAGAGSNGPGYGLFGDNVGLYGPNVHMSRRPRNRGNQQQRSPDERQPGERLAGDPDDPDIPRSLEPGRVRLQREARFPLRYRNIVGEYFRSIADAENE